MYQQMGRGPHTGRSKQGTQDSAVSVLTLTGCQHCEWIIMKPSASPTCASSTQNLASPPAPLPAGNTNIISVDGEVISGTVTNGRASVHTLARHETKERFLFWKKQNVGLGRKYPERTVAIQPWRQRNSSKIGND